ncbi:MAG TPA: putative lipid II flippase FtsW [Candidatus Acidoferrales bacterium]
MPRYAQPDRWLFLTTLALCAIGIVMVFSASAVMAREEYGSGYAFVLRQIVALALGLAGMFALMRTDYRKLRQPGVIYTGVCVVVVLLIAVFFLDKNASTHRWIRFGPVGFQPSELAKLAMIAYLAWFLEVRRRPYSFGMNDLTHTILPALGPVVVIAGLIVMQPDMGTGFQIFLIALAMLFVAGMSFRYVAYAALAALPAVYLLIVRVPYRYERVLAFLHPESDPQGRGFQLLQSLIAVGSGGFTGVGLMESRQKLFYLPEAHTDFIYAVLCEEMGFIGGIILLALFVVYGWRGVRAALAAPDDFGKFLALGVTAMVVGQALINLSVVLGLMPTKGIPLPFVSYGGSSLVVMLLATGVLLNVSQHAE